MDSKTDRSQNQASHLTRLRSLVRIYNWIHGTRLRRAGVGQTIELHNARMRNTRIECYGDGLSLDIGEDVRLFNCSILIKGAGARLRIGARTCLRGVRIVVEDDGSDLSIGDGTTMTEARVQAKEGGSIQIGRDCMVGFHSEITNSDSHSLLDRASGVRLNPAKDVRLGEHVWIGAQCWVGKGSSIGEQSVIAARSRVSGSIPAGVMAAGDPAAPRRTGVTWSRERIFSS